MMMYTNEIMSEVKICIHHHPIGLFTITKGILNEYLAKEESFCTFDVSTKVMELHFKNQIGYVPLLESLHEKFHNGFLQIPKEMIKGNYRSFLSEYSKYLDESDLENIDEKLAINESNCNWTRNSYPGLENAANG